MSGLISIALTPALRRIIPLRAALLSPFLLRTALPWFPLHVSISTLLVPLILLIQFILLGRLWPRP
jgi:hypothetical protein